MNTRNILDVASYIATAIEKDKNAPNFVTDYFTAPDDLEVSIPCCSKGASTEQICTRRTYRGASTRYRAWGSTGRVGKVVTIEVACCWVKDERRTDLHLKRDN